MRKSSALEADCAANGLAELMKQVDTDAFDNVNLVRTRTVGTTETDLNTNPELTLTQP